MVKKSSGAASQRQPLTDVLTASGQSMAPEELLREAGYDNDSIEDFYVALREEIDKGYIQEDRSSKSDVTLRAVA